MRIIYVVFHSMLCYMLCSMLCYDCSNGYDNVNVNDNVNELSLFVNEIICCLEQANVAFA